MNTVRQFMMGSCQNGILIVVATNHEEKRANERNDEKAFRHPAKSDTDIGADAGNDYNCVSR